MNIFNRLGRRGIILMYHRVIDLAYDPRNLSVSPARFEEHLQVIQKYGSPLQMKRMGTNLTKISLGRQEIVITLDDGYADNFHNAKPLLEKHGVPATFFIISGSIGSREEFQWDGLERTILAPQSLPPRFELSIGERKFRWQVKPEGACGLLDYSQISHKFPQDDMVLSRAQLYSALNQVISLLAPLAQREAIGALAQWSGQALPPRPEALPMTLDQLLSLAASPLCEIGAHTVHHPHLGELPVARQQEEISHSKQDLENKLSRPVESFSYPYGSYSAETVKILEQMKFSSSCTVEAEAVTRNSNPYLLPRFNVLNWNGDEFEKNLRQWLS